MTTTTTQTTKPFVTIREAAELSGLAESYLRRGCRDGWAPCVRSGKKYYVCWPQLLAQLEAAAAGQDAGAAR